MAPLGVSLKCGFSTLGRETAFGGSLYLRVWVFVSGRGPGYASVANRGFLRLQVWVFVLEI